MTAKKAMITRCLDCCKSLKCDPGCPLSDLTKLKAGINWIGVIFRYCQWCRNRNPINQCVGSGCAIYQYRAKAMSNNHVGFLPKTSITHDAKLQAGTSV
jgi:hypothetical protein